ncbi:hypothetical protein ABB37_00562 [Leptomonas pyrrhocoris]|uniref:Uncharacterized protein n=1 Tax=Leptomonas pyrrhocoris TaxID=157538 RepID=A0A0N0E0F0_LEPPY|nr:hypothetical protein ABB37_00562 [Leptomonas pyrrhocoris]KPA86371.1 hypothetical protein ABB37_00562 [Leptomonas pyrrhocoris]|eukprot:XP_015664810.1 hypothetical protein ABB37_00562 [Leptomonas pyrrhocoris]
MSDGAEEWADEAEGFFNEFAASVSQEKSQRRKNADARQADTLQQQKKVERRDLDRAESAAEARRRITAAVLSRASAKEIEAAARNAKKQQKVNGKNKMNAGASGGAVGSSAGLPGSTASASPSAHLAGKNDPSSSVKQPVEGEPTNKTFGKKREKVDAKFARKAARKEEAKENSIKYRRTLRRQRH